MAFSATATDIGNLRDNGRGVSCLQRTICHDGNDDKQGGELLGSAFRVAHMVDGSPPVLPLRSGAGCACFGSCVDEELDSHVCCVS